MAETTPVATSANWLDAPYNRWGFRHVPDLLPTAVIGRGGGPVRELPRDERDLGAFAFSHEGRRYTLDEMLTETYTDGFLVLADGAVATERYLDGMDESDTHLLMSCSKSVTSLLVGALWGQGLLSPDDLVTDHLPELAGTAWDGCRLQHVLDMRAGVEWDFDVDEYTILDVSDYRTHDLHGTIPADTETWLRTIGPGPYAHGTGPFRYCSLATDVLGWVAARVGGASFAEVLSRELWSCIGAEQDAAILLDHRGFAIVEGGICTTLRDLARLGLHVPRGRPRARRAGRPRRVDRARAGRRPRSAGGVRDVADRGRPAAGRLLPRLLVGRRRPARDLRGARHERAVAADPPPDADGHRQVLDVPGRARLGSLRAAPRGHGRPLRVARH